MLYVRNLSRSAPLAAVGVLVIAGLAIGGLYAAKSFVQSADNYAVVDIQADPVADIEALTDRGVSVPLFQIKFLTPESEVEQFVLELEAQQLHVTRIQSIGPKCNCHGWVFTGGEFSLRDFEVQAILNDNGYEEVEQPRAGDLIVYANEGEITHSGIVRRLSEEGRAVIESKWGPFGVYEHAPEDQPYAAEYRYFRSARGTHMLRFHWQAWMARNHSR